MKQANIGATSSAPIRVPRWAYPLVTVAGLLLGAEAIVRGTRAVVTITDSDLTNFFFRSADYILRGDPWHMYAVRASGNYPNYNPPLSIALMTPLLALARSVGFDKNYGELITFVSIPFMVFVPLLGYLVLRVLRQLYPEIPEAQRFLAYALIVLSPLTWQSYGTWYHIEQPMMLCLLVAAVLALQQRHEALAGLLAGLALMTRTTSLIPLIALGVLLLLAREWRALFKLAGIAMVVVAVIMAPFFLVDRTDTTYSFLTWRGTAPIGGNSIWSIFAASNNATGLRHTLDALARHLDMPSVIVLVVAVTFLALRRFHISAYARDAWAVLAIAALAIPMLSKTNWPYYYLEPFVLLLIWEFTSMHDRRAGVWRWPVLSVSYLATTATLSQYLGLESVGFLDRVGLGILEFGAMLAFAILIWLRLQAAKPGIGDAENLSLGNRGAVPQPTFNVSNMPPGGGPALQHGGGAQQIQRGPSTPQQQTVLSPPSSLNRRQSTQGSTQGPVQGPTQGGWLQQVENDWQQPPRPQPRAHDWGSSPLASNWPNQPASPAPSPKPPSFSGVDPVTLSNTSGGLLRDTPPWQQDGSLPSLPDQWPDLNNLGELNAGWPSSTSQPPPRPAGPSW